ncbi:TPA: hypothetical protein KKN35_000569 [Shigella sonnei]|uniref:Uncharacterized protein n=1 Tax=Enterobacteria phage JenK1 TaxID=1610836 RepID=A0A0E3JIZ4_9CAUD|nr:hypothetical protein AVU35_gp21 [Enterobacteria phage JenK1]AKA61061.1 hypothetical protein [Enterobacteria phage JenK1]HBD6162631.1 hypothetical protein [Shigella sonnei]HBD9953611.1 hypothetical protein [Shigella sonnei]
MKTLICAIILSMTATFAYATGPSGGTGGPGNGGAGGPGSGSSLGGHTGGVSNIEHQTSIYEGTTAGKAKAEWMKGKKVKPDCSPAMNRVGWSEGCK